MQALIRATSWLVSRRAIAFSLEIDSNAISTVSWQRKNRDCALLPNDILARRSVI